VRRIADGSMASRACVPARQRLPPPDTAFSAAYSGRREEEEGDIAIRGTMTSERRDLAGASSFHADGVAPDQCFRDARAFRPGDLATRGRSRLSARATVLRAVRTSSASASAAGSGARPRRTLVARLEMARRTRSWAGPLLRMDPGNRVWAQLDVRRALPKFRRAAQ